MKKSITPIGLFYKNWVGCEGLSEFEELVGPHQILEEAACWRTIQTETRQTNLVLHCGFFV